MDITCMERRSPFRVKDWRWVRAKYLFESGERFRPRFDDDWVRRALLFVAGSEGPPQHPDKPRVDQTLADALSIWRDGPQFKRALLESCILTGESLTYAATRCQLDVEVVTAYEALFFNISDRLAARDWVAREAIGETSPAAYRADFPWRIWRSLAYSGGKHALETVIAVTTDESMPAPEDLSPTEARAWVATTRFHCSLLIAAMIAEPAQLAALASLSQEGRANQSRAQQLR